MSDAIIRPMERRYRHSKAFRDASGQTQVTATHYRRRQRPRPGIWLFTPDPAGKDLDSIAV